jgi:hypothetical protein
MFNLIKETTRSSACGFSTLALNFKLCIFITMMFPPLLGFDSKGQSLSLLRNGPAPRKKTRVCTHEHWKSCYDVPEAHRYEEAVPMPVVGPAEESRIAALVNEHRQLLEGSDKVTAGYARVRMT